MIGTMNLRKRILLGYLMPILLMLGVAVAVYWNIGTMHQISDDLDQSYAIAENMNKAHNSLAQMQRSARGYVLYKNEESRKNFRLGQAILQEKLKVLTDKVRDPAQMELLRQFSELSGRMVSEEQKYLDLVDAGKASQAVAMFREGKSIKLVSELDAMAMAMAKRDAEIVDEGHRAESNALDRLMAVAAGAVLFALALAMLLGAWMAARIGQSISEAIAGVSSSSTQIAAAVTETSSTVEELSVSSRQSAGQAESTATAAKHSLEMTQEGIQLANQVSACIADMKQKVGSVAEQILRLSEQAGQIGGIAKVVGELAGETNMLALNAAVEAARAGEHGKGFAVVAAEVRKLADQSKKSAERANALVAEIQKATNSAVMVTEEGSATAAEVGRITDKTIEAFGSISVEANGVSVSAQQMRMNTAQQAAALTQVTEAMKNLSASTTQLNGVAKSLKSMV